MSFSNVDALTAEESFEDFSESDREPSDNLKHRISSEPVESQGESQQSTTSVDQELGCGICLDVLTTPYTILPCLHTFDKSCLIQWWKKNDNCPTCKKTSTSAKSAFQLKAIMDRVHKNRNKRRKLSETTNTNEIFPCGDPDEDSEDSQQSNFQDAQPIPPGGGLVWPCITCVPNNHTGYTCPTPLPNPTSEQIEAVEALHPDWAPVTAPLRGQGRVPLDTAIEDGLPGASGHSLCAGCQTYVPLGFPQAIRCGGCTQVYCHNVEPAGCPSYLTFVARNDVALAPHDVSTLQLFFPPLVQNNRHEMTRFADYIAGRNLPLADILLALFEAKRIQTAEDVNQDVAEEHWGADAWFCAHCVNSVAASMLFKWWMKERQDSLERQDGFLPTKPDCWYGRECRTQTHNDSHAERLNHICENTRVRT